MESKLAACIGFSIRLARRDGQECVVEHLQHAMFGLIRDDAQQNESTSKRRKISLFQALSCDIQSDDSVGSSTLPTGTQTKKSYMDSG